jgi:hypothetical protein
MVQRLVSLEVGILVLIRRTAAGFGTPVASSGGFVGQRQPLRAVVASVRWAGGMCHRLGIGGFVC